EEERDGDTRDRGRGGRVAVRLGLPVAARDAPVPQRRGDRRRHRHRRGDGAGRARAGALRQPGAGGVAIPVQPALAGHRAAHGVEPRPHRGGGVPPVDGAHRSRRPARESRGALAGAERFFPWRERYCDPGKKGRARGVFLTDGEGRTKEERWRFRTTTGGSRSGIGGRRAFWRRIRCAARTWRSRVPPRASTSRGAPTTFTTCSAATISSASPPCTWAPTAASAESALTAPAPRVVP